MILRDYQLDAVDATFKAWESSPAVLGVAATGLGKTIIFGSIVHRIPGRVMVLAHREELIFQAADKVGRVAKLDPSIEMADIRANEEMVDRSRVVISTIQTQVAGNNGGRMTRFKPDEFSLLIIDEAHHVPAGTYRKVIDYYRQNPNLKVLGVTATPDRKDELALGQVFDVVAFNYDIRYGVENGWLVPIVQRMVKVDGLDLSSIRTTAGDLNQGDLARVMEYERNLHEIASPTMELVGKKKALVFAASLAHAERLFEILDRHKTGTARWVHGGTPKPERRELFKDYSKGKFQFLVNVGVATEGFDDPSIGVIVMARPTKSRALYTQMAGRGTRTLPGIVDDPDMFGSASMRREAIAASGKPEVEIIDFTGNSGKHQLITTTDILGGKYSPAVVARAKKLLEEGGEGDTMQTLDFAEQQLKEEAEAQKKREAERRAKLVIKASYSTTTKDPFSILGIETPRESGWTTGRAVTEKMARLLASQDIDPTHLTFAQARQLISEITGRWDRGECSFKQARILARHGFPTTCSKEDASRYIDEIFNRPRKVKAY